ncbi:hypothetical protein ACFLT1_08480 [Bacteroidota bacterium]
MVNTREIEKELQILEDQEKIIIGRAKIMLSSDLFSLDLLAIAALDRSLHLIFGFTNLIKADNFIAAAHLVRCHLDNLLRLSAAWLVDDPHDFAQKILDGKRVDELVDQKGHKLKDWYLRDKLNEEYPWVKNVYKETSGFIHLSDKHFFSTSRRKDDKSREVEFRISKTDNFVPESARIEAIKCMNEITNVLIKYIEGWIWTKQNPGQFPT